MYLVSREKDVGTVTRKLHWAELIALAPPVPPFLQTDLTHLATAHKETGGTQGSTHMEEEVGVLWENDLPSLSPFTLECHTTLSLLTSFLRNQHPPSTLPLQFHRVISELRKFQESYYNFDVLSFVRDLVEEVISEEVDTTSALDKKLYE